MRPVRPPRVSGAGLELYGQLTPLGRAKLIGGSIEIEILRLWLGKKEIAVISFHSPSLLPFLKRDRASQDTLKSVT